MGMAHDECAENEDKELGLNVKNLINARQLQHRLTSILPRCFLAVVRSAATLPAWFVRLDRERWHTA